MPQFPLPTASRLLGDHNSDGVDQPQIAYTLTLCDLQVSVFSFLADRTNGRAIGTVLRPSACSRRL